MTRAGVTAERSTRTPSVPADVGRPRRLLRLRDEALTLGERTWVMGVLNVTPDSFWDGGRDADVDAAVTRGLALFEAGADIVDVGGESTRPGGVSRVPEQEEARRVLPVIDGLRRRCKGFVSVDTSRASVARAALEAGADVVNDISGFGFDPELGPLVGRAGASAVLMHLRGGFAAMHRTPSYADVAADVVAELSLALDRAAAGGVPEDRIVVDPGIGFSKDARHSLELLARLRTLHALGRPVLVGPSRKSFIGKTLDLPVGERLFGTAAAVAACVLNGAHIVRVHDVAEMLQVARLADAILAAGEAAAC